MESWVNTRLCLLIPSIGGAEVLNSSFLLRAYGCFLFSLLSYQNVRFQTIHLTNFYLNWEVSLVSGYLTVWGRISNGLASLSCSKNDHNRQSHPIFCWDYRCVLQRPAYRFDFLIISKWKEPSVVYCLLRSQFWETIFILSFSCLRILLISQKRYFFLLFTFF